MIPSLGKVLDWSKGKTIANLDKKYVPLQMIVDLIKKHKAAMQVDVDVAVLSKNGTRRKEILKKISFEIG